MASGLPVVDIGPFFAGAAGGKSQVAKQVARACEEVGFLIITGHGVPCETTEAMTASAREFFNLPVAEKARSAPKRADYPRGYSGLMAESLAYSAGQKAPPDLKESLSIGQVDVPDDEYYRCPQAGLAFAPNIWPESPNGLREVWTAYFRAMERLAADVMRIFAVGLDLPEHFFDDKLDRHVSVLRALNYPEPDGAPLRGQLRAGEHSDFGSLTILLQEDRPGGLQVRSRRGGWVDAHPVPDSFTVNIGDLMQMWTNDRWGSTVHRVAIPPPDKNAGSRRQSIAFFQQPNYDALISCLESCRGGRLGAAKYPPVTSGEHMMMKIMKTRMLLEPGAEQRL